MQAEPWLQLPVTFRGPHYRDADLSFGKNIRLPAALHLGEASNLQLRANFFNLFNTLNLAPFAFDSGSTNLNETQFFGRATAGLAGRVVELQGRLSSKRKPPGGNACGFAKLCFA